MTGSDVRTNGKNITLAGLNLIKNGNGPIWMSGKDSSRFHGDKVLLRYLVSAKPVGANKVGFKVEEF
jgi:hypothetical protein